MSNLIPLKYLSDEALADLRKNIVSNLSRYQGEGFLDFAENPAWDIDLGIKYDGESLFGLDRGKPQDVARVDLENSRIVGRSLCELSITTFLGLISPVCAIQLYRVTGKQSYWF